MLVNIGHFLNDYRENDEISYFEDGVSGKGRIGCIYSFIGLLGYSPKPGMEDDAWNGYTYTPSPSMQFHMLYLINKKSYCICDLCFFVSSSHVSLSHTDIPVHPQ